MLIATAGHIDHGKTSLIRALTGVETDRLPEEKARGISIDLGFAYWRPDAGQTIGFIDVPGHQRFVRNMIAGLGGAGHALMVVAADDGIMPQTIEHLEILELLGIRCSVFVMTKADRVVAAQLAKVRGEIDDLLADGPFASVPVVQASATSGTGISELAALLKALRQNETPDERHGFRLAIDRAFSIAGAGTVVTGTVIAGLAKVGDRLTLSPLGREVRVRSMQSAGVQVDTIGAGQRCAFNLAGIETGEVHRGDWLVAPNSHASTSRIEARLALTTSRAIHLRHDTRVHLHLGAADLVARVLLPGQRSIAPGRSGDVQLVLDQPTTAVCGERFILRDQSGRDLIGGGIVLDPLAQTRRRSPAERAARAAALAQVDDGERLMALAGAAGIEPDRQWFARACNLTDAAMQSILDTGGFRLAGKAGTIAITAGRHTRLGESLIATLGTHHRDHPGQGGMPRRAARLAIGEPLSADLYASLIADLTATGQVVAEGPLLRLPGHAAAFSPAETEFWRRTLAAVEGGSPRVITVAELTRELSGSQAAVMAMLHRRRASGDLWQVTDSKFMLREHVASLASLAAGLDTSDRIGFTPAEFRDASGIGRNFVIQLLEFFDRIGVTRRTGERRHLRADWQSVTGGSE